MDRREFLKIASVTAISASIPISIATNLPVVTQNTDDYKIIYAYDYDINTDQMFLIARTKTESTRYSCTTPCRRDQIDEMKILVENGLIEKLTMDGIRTQDLLRPGMPDHFSIPKYV